MKNEGTKILVIVLIVLAVATGAYFLYAKISGKSGSTIFKTSNNAAANYQKGQELLAQNNYTAAAKYFEQACNSDPANYNYFIKLGSTYYNLKDYDKAITAYEKAMKLSPNDAFVYNCLGNIYRDKSDDAKAKSYYGEAIKANPNFVLAYSNYALVLQKEGDKDQAVKIMEEGIANNPSNQDLKNTLETIKK